MDNHSVWVSPKWEKFVAMLDLPIFQEQPVRFFFELSFKKKKIWQLILFLKNTLQTEVSTGFQFVIYSRCYRAVTRRGSIPRWQLWPAGIGQTERNKAGAEVYSEEDAVVQARGDIDQTFPFPEQRPAQHGSCDPQVSRLSLHSSVCFQTWLFWHTGGRGTWFSTWFVSGIELGDKHG